MPEFNHILKFSADANIRDINGKLMLKVIRFLDVGTLEGVAAWRVFAAKLKGRLQCTGQDVEMWALELQRGNSPTTKMIMELGSKAMNVKELVEILHELQIEVLLKEFLLPQSVSIVRQPDHFMKVKEGEQLSLFVEASGFPLPCFLWHKLDTVSNKPVPTHHTQSMLHVDCARQEDAGDYCCLVYNVDNDGQFSDWCSVAVKRSQLTNTDLTTACKSSLLPEIVQQPWPMNVVLGQGFYLFCEAIGEVPLNYSWFCNSIFVCNTPTGYLQITHAHPYDNGVYQCVVTNALGTTKSECVKVCVASNEMHDFVLSSLVPEIIEHPKSCQVQLGGHAMFRCVGGGTGQLNYTWFKDLMCIPGATDSEFCVYNVDHISKQGSYFCMVSNDFGGKVISKSAILLIAEITTKPKYSATDKVALLIGNYDYLSQLPLKAPQTDIQNLSHIFEACLGFKVLSLLNLTLVEMVSAVDEFCEMIESGVYCLFYFCGHGFEAYNATYIMPSDVPTNHSVQQCLSTSHILRQMQLRRPRVCCMILDMCREPPNRPNGVMGVPMEIPDAVSDGNTIVCYATSCGLAAFESHPNNKGILVTHLEKLLPEPSSIEEVFRKVKEAVGRDKRVNRNERTMQIPEVHSNLIDSRSFTDPTEMSGHSRASTMRQVAWGNAHVTPDALDVRMNPVNLGVVVQLKFQHEFSNVLTILASVISKGHVSDCIAWISTIPSSVSIRQKPTCQRSSDKQRLTTTRNVIDGIQKLKENLYVSLSMKYCLPGEQHYHTSDGTDIDLKLPLVARLKLWMPRPLYYCQQGENCKVSAQPVQKPQLEIESDIAKLTKFCCGANIYTTGSDPELKTDNEYPDWLWTLRTDRRPVPLSELDPDDWAYWRRLRKQQIKERNKLLKVNKLKS